METLCRDWCIEVTLRSPNHLWEVKNWANEYWQVRFACWVTPNGTYGYIRPASTQPFRFLLWSRMQVVLSNHSLTVLRRALIRIERAYERCLLPVIGHIQQLRHSEKCFCTVILSDSPVALRRKEQISLKEQWPFLVKTQGDRDSPLTGGRTLYLSCERTWGCVSAWASWTISTIGSF